MTPQSASNLSSSRNAHAFARFAVVRNARRLARAGCEVLIAETALAAARDLHAFAVLREIVQKRFGLAFERAIDERADGHANREIRTAAPGFIRLPPALPDSALNWRL